MAYLVFARKYRPLTFDDVVGQQHITQTLGKAIERDRVAHAYIFTGTRGVGKTTTARILARALNCDNGPTPAPCGECESCKQIISGSSFDVLEIDGASNNSVDDVRELRDNINYSSMGGKHRVFVIDEVHMLSKAAFNALLKTLEEPPPRVIFIFATTEPHRIPATIHSRCQRYDFRRISAEQIRGRLEMICTSEGVSFDSEGLALVARKADGSMRDALSLLDQVYSYCQEGIREEDVRTVLGLVGNDVYAKILKGIHEHQPDPVLDAVQDMLFRGFDLHEFVVGLEEYVRDLLLSRLADGDKGPSAAGELSQTVIEQGRLFDERTLLRMADHIRRAENDLARSAYPRFLVETLLLKLVYMDDTVALEKLLSMVGDGDGLVAPDGGMAAGVAEKKKPINSPPPPPVPEPQPVEPPHVAESPEYELDDTDVPPEPVASEPEPPRSSQQPLQGSEVFDDDAPGEPTRNLLEDWPEFLTALKEDRPNLALFLSHGHIASFAGHTLDLRFAPSFKFQFAQVTSSQNRAIVEKKLASFAGVPIDLHMTLESEDANPDAKNFVEHMGGAPTRSIEDDMRSEPIIKTVLEAFDGEVIQ